MPFHEMKIRVMNTSSPGTQESNKNCLRKDSCYDLFTETSALALVHGDVSDVIYASDLAQKDSGVAASKIPGSCPQNLTCLGIMGDVAAVQHIQKEIHNNYKN